jgi:hypothetical protein
MNIPAADVTLILYPDMAGALMTPACFKPPMRGNRNRKECLIG